MIEQQEVQEKLDKIFQIFKATEGTIRPHFILTGSSGSGKSYSIQTLALAADLDFLEVNAAQLTKEGLAGNSLSKALAPLMQKAGRLTVIFVDEFDKLFISGNNNSDLAHESTTGVQNEFLKVLESNTAQVFGDYGKYVSVPMDKTLFVFAGAFNGAEELDIDKLRDFGIKTEFLGRVGLVYNLKKPSLESMYLALEKSKLLADYLRVFKDAKRAKVVELLKNALQINYEKNTLGIRLINTLLHKYFINGGKLTEDNVKESAFQTTLSLGNDSGK